MFEMKFVKQQKNKNDQFFLNSQIINSFKKNKKKQLKKYSFM